MNFPKALFAELYGTNQDVIESHIARYTKLATEWESYYKTKADLRFFSSPGRSEIGGNHTDHNLGKVLAASIQLDCIAAVALSGDDIIRVHDITYNKDFSIDTADTQRIPDETSSPALIRGIVQGFNNAGYKIGGFNACFTSDVIPSAGVSSSAAFEMIICLILDKLFNGGTIPVEKYASVGQFSENHYWDKASGLLDQMACAVGGLVAMDFKNPTDPIVEKIAFDFAKQNYSLMIVNTGKGHADLSKEYSSIPNEMKDVAAQLGQTTLRGLDYADVIANLPKIRKNCGDRAVMRAFHFIEENNRVDDEVAALKENDFQKFLSLIADSGNSSWKWLQNTYVIDLPQEQSIPVCLALSERFIREKGVGACRIHGGGFAGVIQTFIPDSLREEYTDYMEKALGYDKTGTERSPVHAMFVRPYGAVEIC
ncbi:MAG: galactokinase family protein [Spirochaetales bacterium]